MTHRSRVSLLSSGNTAGVSSVAFAVPCDVSYLEKNTPQDRSDHICHYERRDKGKGVRMSHIPATFQSHVPRSKRLGEEVEIHNPYTAIAQAGQSSVRYMQNDSNTKSCLIALQGPEPPQRGLQSRPAGEAFARKHRTGGL